MTALVNLFVYYIVDLIYMEFIAVPLALQLSSEEIYMELKMVTQQ